MASHPHPHPPFQSPAIPQGKSKVVLLGLGLVLAVFLLLPLTQWVSSEAKPSQTFRTIDIAPPPPPPPPLQPPPSEASTDEPPPEIITPPEPLTLSQIEMTLNPGTGGALVGDFSLGFQTLEETIEALRIFELSEVDHPPRPLVQTPPEYPSRLNFQRVSGSVEIVCIVDEQGRVLNPQVSRSDRQEFVQASLRAVQKWKFQPARKNGEPVQVRVHIPFEFTPTR